MSARLRKAIHATILFTCVALFVDACASAGDAPVAMDIAVIEGDFDSFPTLIVNYFDSLDIKSIDGEEIGARRAEVAPGEHIVAVILSRFGFGLDTGWCKWSHPLTFRFLAEGGHTYKLDVVHLGQDIVLKDLTSGKELLRKDYHLMQCR